MVKINDDGSLQVYAEDDLMTRAENIVYMMGQRGAVAEYVISMYRLLQTYEKLDVEAELQEVVEEEWRANGL